MNASGLDASVTDTIRLDPFDAPATVYLRTVLLMNWNSYLTSGEYRVLNDQQYDAVVELQRRRSDWEDTTRRIASARATTPKAVALRSTPVTTTTQAGVRRLLITA